MGYIYVISNNLTNKMYIGQTRKTPKDRFKKHMNHPTSKGVSDTDSFHADIRDLGRDCFSLFTLKSNVNDEELDYWERFFIHRYKTNVYGYNQTAGGGGILGYRHTEKTKSSISKTLALPEVKKSIFTKERANKISVALSGVKKSEEHRKKLSEIAKTRVGEKNSFYGRHHTKQSIEKIKQKSKPVVAIDCVTNEKIHFSGIYKAIEFLRNKEKTNIKQSSMYLGIYRNLNKNHVWHGYIWFWE